MSDRLTEQFKEQLEQWIETGPKKFDLLYSITRDGCNVKTFHQKCDDQGPTVTVLYNPQGSVYGGYTAISWNQAGGSNGCDAKAFLFRLQFSGSTAAVKFSCKAPNVAIYRNINYGPFFGDGKHLYTFNSTINRDANGYYRLNGNLNGWDVNYDSQGISADQINNGTMDVLELEVYRVTDGKRVTAKTERPWRETPKWNAEFLDGLKSEVEKFAPLRAVQVPQFKILLLGPVGSGKSSFFNTIASVFRGRITVQAPCGSAEHSLTSKFRMYRVRNSASGQPLKFQLCDTRGLEDGQGMDGNDISYVLDGNLPDGFQFNPSLPISPEAADFKKSTTLKDKIHCVCIVIDGSTGGVLPEKMLEKIKSIQSKINVRGIPQLVLLTKVDKVCPKVNEDLSQVFSSTAVLEQVNKISQLLGIPANQVLPTKNYITEIELNESVSILALLTVRQLLRAAEDYLFNFLEDGHRDSDDATGLTPE